MRLLIHELAFEEFLEALEEIGHFSPRAADDFSGAFIAAARDVAEHPFSDRPVGRYRERIMGRFNRRFLYLVDEKMGEIWIMHLLSSVSSKSTVSQD